VQLFRCPPVLRKIRFWYADHLDRLRHLCLPDDRAFRRTVKQRRALAEAFCANSPRPVRKERREHLRNFQPEELSGTPHDVCRNTYCSVHEKNKTTQCRETAMQPVDGLLCSTQSKTFCVFGLCSSKVTYGTWNKLSCDCKLPEWRQNR